MAVPPRRCHERDAARHSVRYSHVEVWMVRGVCRRVPPILSVRSPHERRMSAMRARERRQTTECRLQPRRTQESSVLLSTRSQSALGKGDESTRVACVQIGNARKQPYGPVTSVHEKRRGYVPPVCGVFEQVFLTGVACGP
eukprot:1289807-Pleurochrysis_carterae.AAC.1